MDIRIGTWNLERADGAAKNIARLDRLLAADAHIWVLTETHDAVAIPGYHAVRSAPRKEARAGSHWVTIWSRWEAEILVVADSDRMAAPGLTSLDVRSWSTEQSFRGSSMPGRMATREGGPSRIGSCPTDRRLARGGCGRSGGGPEHEPRHEAFLRHDARKERAPRRNRRAWPAIVVH
jgi:hypothetical protein